MVDEMDLVRTLNDAARLRPEAYERARMTLRGAIAGSAPVTPPSLSEARRRRFPTIGKVGIGAGIGAVAAAVAVAVVVTSSPQAAAPKSGATAAGGSAAKSPAVQSKLVTLAAMIKASGASLPGDASLVIRDQKITGIPADISYNLYADNGAFYGGGDKSSLEQAVSRHQNLSNGVNSREVAAARYAANGDLTTARQQMTNATPNGLGLGLSPAARQQMWDKTRAQADKILKEKGAKFRIPPHPPTGKALEQAEDNSVWNNAVDALSSGAGNPQVREGVLRLLATISGVTVANSQTGGQATLTLTAGPEVFGGSGSEILTINATTGMPIKAVFPAYQNVPASVQTFQVLRVTLAQVEAGKF
jgi:hypothetical protein